MQYLLEEQEYKDLLEAKDKRSKAEEAKLMELCMLAAERIPVKLDWAPEREPAPWGCILSKVKRASYCDECPAAPFCPCPRKEWSK